MIVLINPPQLYSPTQETAGVVPPLGLAYLAAALSAEGYDVKIIDAVGECYWKNFEWEGHRLRGLNFDEILQRIPPDSRWIGVSNLYTFAFLVSASLAEYIRKRLPKVPIVFGGAHSTIMPQYTLSRDYIDAVVLSEGEISAVQLTQAFDGEIPFNQIDGLAYRDNGETVINPKTSFIKDLDTVPFPRRGLLPMENYYNAREPHGNICLRKWTTMIASRGCPYGCTFCNTPEIWQRRWRIRSPENVVEEIKQLKDDFGIEEIHFEDENLCLRKDWVLKFCQLLIDGNLNIMWQPSNGIRAESAVDETVSAMKQAGCTNITIAAESGSPRVLKEVINKALKLEAVETAVAAIHKHKLKSAVYFMLGLPGEKKSDVFKSIALAGKLARQGANEVDFSIFSPLPGSVLMKKLVEEGRAEISEDFFDHITPHGDMLNADSYSEYISDIQVILLKYTGYAWFYFNRLIFYPFSVIGSFINVLKDRQTTKTERVLRTVLMRLLGKSRGEKIE
ncbi:B12-binding domain-containing radical SAM protein [bacterium]|nr:B12-binding domain-containing radical SAM protein [FCB group bacterium]MBL7190871.1 B12-binding domain-containing radical SAM protein [bacterium]